MKILGIIPARYASSRFPGKPLVDIRGRSMVMRVFDQASQCSELAKVVVATDDKRIFDHVEANGGAVVMTGEHHNSGTDRCLEALEIMQHENHYDAVINIQGDEPFIDPEQIAQVAQILQQSDDVQIATLVKKTSEKEELSDPNTVKAVTDISGRALYFSRAPIPWHRDEKMSPSGFTHVGIYGYKSEVLRQIAALPPAPPEITEKLEQLRWLYNGFTIHTAETAFESKGIDTPEDLSKLINIG